MRGDARAMLGRFDAAKGTPLRHARFPMIRQALTRSRCNSGPAIRAISLQTKAFPIVSRSCLATVPARRLETEKPFAISGFEPSR